MSNVDMVSAIMPINNFGLLFVDDNSTCLKLSFICRSTSDEAGYTFCFKL